MINKIIEITNFLDNARWYKKYNNSLINFYRNGLSEDLKILTHWICYINERNTPFQRIWDIGGFIFSELVEEMHKQRNLEILNPNNPNKSFFLPRKNEVGKFTFYSHQKVNNNEILKEYGFKSDQIPNFISVYYPADYKSILSTFDILKDKKFDFSFTKFIIHILNMCANEKDAIVQKLLYALYLLTYYDISRPNASGVADFRKILKKIEIRTKKVNEIISDKGNFYKKFEKFKNSKTYFKQKRAWCALRDLLKSPEFKKYFFTSLKNEGYKNITLLKSNSILRQLELPGDVWNKNPKFRKCLFKNTSYENSNLEIQELLRNIYTTEKIDVGSPEIFDITFDFVPRMCNVDNCSICPYGFIKKKGVDYFKICINKPGKLCTVALICCNYKIECQGENCQLNKVLKNLKESL